MKKNKFKLIYIPIALSILICATMIGLIDYIYFGFDISIIEEPDFWINIIITNTATTSVITAVILIRVDNYRSNDVSYLDNLKILSDFKKDQSKYIMPFLNHFCCIDNDKTKLLYYKNSINKKYSKLKPTSKDLDILYNGTEEQRNKNKYCSKLKYYDKLLSDEYINANINKLKVNYPSITPNLIFGGIDQDAYKIDYITKNKVLKVVTEYAPRFLISLTCVILLSSVTLDLKDCITLATIFRTITKLFTILIQIYFAYNYADKYNQEVTLHDIQFRVNKLNEYEVWLANRIQEIKDKKQKEE